jgi:hypothetical protein
MRPTPKPTDEAGMAMVMAVLVTFVVFMLSIVVLQQAIHNVNTSAYDRGRLTAVSAAEAGLDWAYNKLENTSVTNLWTGATPGTVGSGPNSVTYTVTPTYYSDASGTTAFSGMPTSTNYPKSVRVVSVGAAPNSGSRRMETFMVLTPVYGGLNGAVITNSSMTVGNNFTLNGNTGNDADIVVNNGNFSAPSGLETIRGSITVPAGTATIGTNVHIYGTVWANSTVTVNHPQATIDGDVKSTIGGTTVTTGTVNGGASYCTGAAPGSNVLGSKVQTCSLGTPPAHAFPLIQFNQSAWESQGYLVKSFTGGAACTSARTWIEESADDSFHGNVLDAYSGAVVRISSTCNYTASNGNTSVAMPKNLAIVTDGSILLDNNTTWTSSTGSKNLFFMSAYNGTAANCPTQDITVDTRNTFTDVIVSVYTPCKATVANNNGSMAGQVVGATVTISNQFVMRYVPILIPGADIVAFKQDVAYIREVAA